ncbi:V0/A0 complex, 116-kDa subunit of ATPase [Wilcoxina mikolae CBS 423.85]|nr:V0/A0 complex, 116-kDa subunit of ATPase [Wilcoxina mikolae CBS 423.85]
MGQPDTLFRSAEMSLVQLYVATEIGRETVSALGEVGMMQFRDLNADTSAFQRTFTKEIRRLDNVERQLRYFGAQMEKNGIMVRPVPNNANLGAAPSAADIDSLSERASALEERISQLNNSYETLQNRWVELIEYRWVLREAGGFFDRAHHQADDIRQASSDEPSAPLLEDIEQSVSHSNGGNPGELSFQTMNIGFVAGVIPRERIATFERILWRTLRGNLYMNQSEIDEPITDPSTNENVDKNVFVIFAHGKEILAKIRKISESLGADLYSVDEDTNLRRDQLHEVDSRINDLQSVLQNTRNTLHIELRTIAQSLASWMVVIKKEKAVYETLNLFNYDAARKYLVAEGWLPTNSLPLIQATLRDVTEQARLQVPSILNELKTTKTPPTYIKTNKFTEGFQTIINAYGVAKYREVNPGLATVVTFPFLFAVMFGDIGHGFIMFLSASTMIYFERRLNSMKLSEIPDMAFFGRYIMLLMGLFSMYTGLIYNDIFSKPLTLFDSAWKYPEHFKAGDPLEATKVPGYAYPFGLDWAWHSTDNALLFTNSYKMKLSIILGWVHMTYSLCLSQYNHRYFKSRIDTIGNFIPGMLFLQSIFGYLVMCIIYKWTVDWNAIGKPAPSLLNMLIYMFLSPGTIDDQLYPGQQFVQIVLTLIALVCVPWMLLLKPLWLRHEHNKHRAAGYQGLGGTVTRVSALDDDDEESRNSVDSDISAHALIAEEMGEEHEFEFSEEMIHQVIHTIEFCLNCVSHTASYLRLWALSLAHAQLSVVLWEMTLALAFGVTGVIGVIMTVFLFGLWFGCTVIILVIMEGTSAMLHSLRLHWVEAMSKFFIGDGIPFTPFSFKRLLEEEGEG